MNRMIAFAVSTAALLAVPADAQRYMARQHLGNISGLTVSYPSGTPSATPTPAPSPTPTPTPSDPDWVTCASEGGVCTIPGDFAVVRYGADPSWVQNGYYEYVNCTYRDLGDPAQGKSKICQYDSRSLVQPDPKWVTCAVNGGTCSLPQHGSAVVRYGARGKYVSRSVRDGVGCNIDIYGDPYPGESKKCQYDSTTLVPDNSQWTGCATDFNVCKFDGPSEIRYGVPNRYVFVTVNSGGSHTFYCHPDSFSGQDPAPGVQKTCYFDSRTASATPSNGQISIS